MNNKKGNGFRGKFAREMDTWIVQKRSVEPCRDKQDTLDWIKAVFDFSGLTVGVVLSI